MTNRRPLLENLVWALAGAALGLVCGWLVYRPAGETAQTPTGTGQATEVAAAGAPHVAATAIAAAQEPALPAGQRVEAAGGAVSAQRQTVVPTDNSAGDEVQKLRARVQALEAQLASEQTMQRQKQGSPASAPAELAPRFSPETVRMAINTGLRELGLDGEVTAVDCSEYPCLLVGELKGRHFSRDESQRLSQTAALGAYQEDSRLRFGNSRKDGERTVNQFGVAVYPKSDDSVSEENIRKRLRYRFDELGED